MGERVLGYIFYRTYLLYMERHSLYMAKDAKQSDAEMPLRKHGSSSDDETQSQSQPNRENSVDVHIEEKGLTLYLSWKKIAALVCAILVGLSSMGYIVKLT